MADDLIFGRFGELAGLKRGAYDFGSNTRRVAQGDSDANRHGALSRRRRLHASCDERASPARVAAGLKLLDVGFLPQTGQPAFRNALRFLLLEFLLNFAAHFGERTAHAAISFVDLENVKVPAQLDDVADFSGWQIEGHLFQLGRQRFALDPAPIASRIARMSSE